MAGTPRERARVAGALGGPARALRAPARPPLVGGLLSGTSTPARSGDERPRGRPLPQQHPALPCGRRGSARLPRQADGRVARRDAGHDRRRARVRRSRARADPLRIGALPPRGHVAAGRGLARARSRSRAGARRRRAPDVRRSGAPRAVLAAPLAPVLEHRAAGMGGEEPGQRARSPAKPRGGRSRRDLDRPLLAGACGLGVGADAGVRSRPRLRRCIARHRRGGARDDPPLAPGRARRLRGGCGRRSGRL